MPDNRKQLIEKILDIETSMIQRVPSKVRAQCQESPETFRLMRGPQFVDWSEDTLQSYYNDLVEAERKGDNLLTLKYARMDNLIACINLDPLIDKISQIQFEWQKELASKYPNLSSQTGRSVQETTEPGMMGRVGFKAYLMAELETYSHNTLKLLYDDILECKRKGINMSKDIYLELVTKLGFNSLEQAEQLAEQGKKKRL